jgi:hypothetical protein
MIDSYFDRADAAQASWQAAAEWDSNLFWRGKIYATKIDRAVAKALEMVAGDVEFLTQAHKAEIRRGIKLDRDASMFCKMGRRKCGA